MISLRHLLFKCNQGGVDIVLAKGIYISILQLVFKDFFFRLADFAFLRGADISILIENFVDYISPRRSRFIAMRVFRSLISF